MTNEVVRIEAEIVNALGMHARPAAEFVKLAATFSADVQVEKEGVSVNGKSIMGVLMLAAEKGSTLLISTSGLDAPAASAALAQLVAQGFGEEDELEPQT